MRRDKDGRPLDAGGVPIDVSSVSVYENHDGRVLPRGTISLSRGMDEVKEVFSHQKVTSIKYLPPSFSSSVILLQSIPINIYRSNYKRWKIELAVSSNTSSSSNEAENKIQNEEESKDDISSHTSHTSSSIWVIDDDELSARELFLHHLVKYYDAKAVKPYINLSS